MDGHHYRVGVVLLDLNQRELTADLINLLADVRRSLIASQSHISLKVVLLENGANPVGVAESEWLRVHVPGSNIGCAGGRNVGISILQQWGVDHLIILDNDIRFPVDDFRDFLNLSENLKRSILAPKLINADGSVWSQGGIRRGPGSYKQLGDDANHAGNSIITWAPGACLSFSARVWNDVGPFEKRLSFYFEDIEWCLRAFLSDIDVVVTSNIKFVHHANASMGGPQSRIRTFLWARNNAALTFWLDPLGHLTLMAAPAWIRSLSGTSRRASLLIRAASVLGVAFPLDRFVHRLVEARAAQVSRSAGKAAR